MDNNFFESLKEKIQPYFEKSGTHDFAHTQRVYNLAVKIGKEENADLDIIKAAAILHDIARKKEDDGEVECHAEEGSKMAGEILKESGFPEDKIKGVVHAISVHRYSKGLKPETKEAKIVQDADRLDALGAINIARTFDRGAKRNRAIYNPEIPINESYSGSSETSINHFYEKILKLEPETFMTKTAQKIAKGRYEYTKNFVERFRKEWEGEL